MERSGWDVHTHLLPAGLADIAASGRYGMSVDGGNVCVHDARLSLATIGNPEALLSRLDRDGLEGAIVAIPPPLFRADLSVDLRSYYVEAMNSGLLETVAAYPRLRPLAYLPTEQPELAAEVARKLDHRWAGVTVGTVLGGYSYADPAFHPLWQTLSDAGLPVLLHPSESPDPRMAPFYFSNLLGNPFETTLAAAQLIFGDIPARFPALKVILAHGGGASAALIGRWQRGTDTARPGIGPLGLSPTGALRWFYADTIVHHPVVLGFLVALFGEDHLLLGSDWPFPMGAPSAEYDVAGLVPALREKVRGTNAEAVFGRRLAAQDEG
ncbi:MAG: amidohydrolase family protein [Pelagibacterium sp.]|uniref:amidohydrolase family protein n=1 Tax=Pelagibacterium sp. TaxID=1967288 RepID=UPI0032ED3D3A|tara:strand:- start:44577 stop:45551 length:975 start_codon:yes stop_codon:yes gene_type:complete